MSASSHLSRTDGDFLCDSVGSHNLTFSHLLDLFAIEIVDQSIPMVLTNNIYELPDSRGRRGVRDRRGR